MVATDLNAHSFKEDLLITQFNKHGSRNPSNESMESANSTQNEKQKSEESSDCGKSSNELVGKIDPTKLDIFSIREIENQRAVSLVQSVIDPKFKILNPYFDFDVIPKTPEDPRYDPIKKNLDAHFPQLREEHLRLNSQVSLKHDDTKVNFDLILMPSIERTYPLINQSDKIGFESGENERIYPKTDPETGLAPEQESKEQDFQSTVAGFSLVLRSFIGEQVHWARSSTLRLDKKDNSLWLVFLLSGCHKPFRDVFESIAIKVPSDSGGSVEMQLKKVTEKNWKQITGTTWTKMSDEEFHKPVPWDEYKVCLGI